MYYTIQNGSVLTSDDMNILIKFYGEALKLPDDYEKEKYIAQNGELVLNPDWEKVEVNKRILEILAELEVIDFKSIRAIRDNDVDYIQSYKAEAQELREELRSLQE